MTNRDIAAQIKYKVAQLNELLVKAYDKDLDIKLILSSKDSDIGYTINTNPMIIDVQVMESAIIY